MEKIFVAISISCRHALPRLPFNLPLCNSRRSCEGISILSNIVVGAWAQNNYSVVPSAAHLRALLRGSSVRLGSFSLCQDTILHSWCLYCAEDAPGRLRVPVCPLFVSEQRAITVGFASGRVDIAGVPAAGCAHVCMYACVCASVCVPVYIFDTK